MIFADSLPSKDSFWALVTIPKVMVMCFTIFSLSACLGFLDPTMSLFVIETVSHFLCYVYFFFFVFDSIFTSLSWIMLCYFRFIFLGFVLDLRTIFVTVV